MTRASAVPALLVRCRLWKLAQQQLLHLLSQCPVHCFLHRGSHS